MDEVWDVLVLGAGMAGLVCARRLAESGLRVCVVEARPTVGGRVLTTRVGDAVVELGAEFVHGRPPELLALLAEAGLRCRSREGTMVEVDGGRLVADEPEAEEEGTAVLERLRTWEGAEDVSFAAWMEAHGAEVSEEERRSTTSYVEGFNAADAEVISARALGVQQVAEDLIGGDAVGHVEGGYAQVPAFVAERVRAAGGEVRCGVAVTAIRWAAGRVAFETSAGEMVAGKAVVTLPVGLLQAGAVRIVPEPVTILAAARQMRMGVVSRFTCVFRERFWELVEPREAMRELSFLLDFGELPSVWWTARPEEERTLTGWVGGPRAKALLGMGEQELRALAVRQLARIFGVRGEVSAAVVEEQMVAVRTHDWSADAWSGGAYSYVAAGGLGASEAMSRPVEHTLFFAGEHTDTTGHWGTVHGAMRSGERAARQVMGELE